MGALGDGPRSIATGELVFNTCLSGYQEVITDPSYAGQVHRLHLPAHRQLRRLARGRGEPAALLPGRRSSATSPTGPSNWRSAESLEAFLVRHGVAGLTGHRHPPAHPARPRGRRDAVRVRDRLRARAARGGPTAEPGTLGVDLVAEVTTGEPYRVGVRDAGRRYSVVAYDFGIKTTILRNLSRIVDVEVVPATTPASDVLARQPDGVFLSNGPGTRPPSATWSPKSASSSAPCPCSASASATSCWRAALGGETYKLPLRPPRRQPPGASGSRPAPSRSRARTTAMPSPTARVPAPSVTPRQLERRRHRGAPLLGRSRPSACSTTPRPARARTTPATCSRSSGSSWQRAADGPARRHLVDPRHRLRPDRHRPGVRVRLLGHPGLPGAAGGGVPGHPGELEPGHDHDRPGPRGPHLRRAARRSTCSRPSSSASAPTRSCRRWAARRRSTWPWSSPTRRSRAGSASSSSAPRSRRSAPPRTATASRRR